MNISSITVAGNLPGLPSSVLVASPYNPSNLPVPREPLDIPREKAEWEEKIRACKKDVNRAIAIFEQCRSNGEAHVIDTFLYNCLLNACAQARNYPKALEIWDWMNEDKVPPNGYTYNITVNAARTFQEAWYIYELAKEDCQDLNIVFYNTLMNKAESFSQAIIVFKLISNSNIKLDLRSFNILMNKVDNFQDALTIFKSAQAANQADIYLFTILITKASSVSKAEKIIKKMHAAGIAPDEVTYAAFMQVCANTKNPQKAIEILEELKKSKVVKIDECILNSFFDALITDVSYFELGKKILEESLEVYGKSMPTDLSQKIDCHRFSHGAACLFVLALLDKAHAVKCLTILPGKGLHLRQSTMGVMREILIDFLKKYSRWLVRRNKSNTGIFFLIRPVGYKPHILHPTLIVNPSSTDKASNSKNLIQAHLLKMITWAQTNKKISESDVKAFNKLVISKEKNTYTTLEQSERFPEDLHRFINLYIEFSRQETDFEIDEDLILGEIFYMRKSQDSIHDILKTFYESCLLKDMHLLIEKNSEIPLRQTLETLYLLPRLDEEYRDSIDVALASPRLLAGAFTLLFSHQTKVALSFLEDSRMQGYLTQSRELGDIVLSALADCYRYGSCQNALTLWQVFKKLQVFFISERSVNQFRVMKGLISALSKRPEQCKAVICEILEKMIERLELVVMPLLTEQALEELAYSFFETAQNLIAVNTPWSLEAAEKLKAPLKKVFYLHMDKAASLLIYLDLMSRQEIRTLVTPLFQKSEDRNVNDTVAKGLQTIFQRSIVKKKESTETEIALLILNTLLDPRFSLKSIENGPLASAVQDYLSFVLKRGLVINPENIINALTICSNRNSAQALFEIGLKTNRLEALLKAGRRWAPALLCSCIARQLNGETAIVSAEVVYNVFAEMIQTACLKTPWQRMAFKAELKRLITASNISSLQQATVFLNVLSLAQTQVKSDSRQIEIEMKRYVGIVLDVWKELSVISEANKIFEILKVVEGSTEALLGFLRGLCSIVKGQPKDLFFIPEQDCNQVSRAKHYVTSRIELENQLNKKGYTSIASAFLAALDPEFESFGFKNRTVFFKYVQALIKMVDASQATPNERIEFYGWLEKTVQLDPESQRHLDLNLAKAELQLLSISSDGRLLHQQLQQLFNLSPEQFFERLSTWINKTDESICKSLPQSACKIIFYLCKAAFSQTTHIRMLQLGYEVIQHAHKMHILDEYQASEALTPLLLCDPEMEMDRDRDEYYVLALQLWLNPLFENGSPNFQEVRKNPREKFKTWMGAFSQSLVRKASSVNQLFALRDCLRFLTTKHGSTIELPVLHVLETLAKKAIHSEDNAVKNFTFSILEEFLFTSSCSIEPLFIDALIDLAEQLLANQATTDCWDNGMLLLRYLYRSPGISSVQQDRSLSMLLYHTLIIIPENCNHLSLDQQDRLAQVLQTILKMQVVEGDLFVLTEIFLQGLETEGEHFCENEAILQMCLRNLWKIDFLNIDKILQTPRYQQASLPAKASYLREGIKNCDWHGKCSSSFQKIGDEIISFYHVENRSSQELFDLLPSLLHFLLVAITTFKESCSNAVIDSIHKCLLTVVKKCDPVFIEGFMCSENRVLIKENLRFLRSLESASTKQIIGILEEWKNNVEKDIDTYIIFYLVERLGRVPSKEILSGCRFNPECALNAIDVYTNVFKLNKKEYSCDEINSLYLVVQLGCEQLYNKKDEQDFLQLWMDFEAIWAKVLPRIAARFLPEKTTEFFEFLTILHGILEKQHEDRRILIDALLFDTLAALKNAQTSKDILLSQECQNFLSQRILYWISLGNESKIFDKSIKWIVTETERYIKLESCSIVLQTLHKEFESAVLTKDRVKAEKLLVLSVVYPLLRKVTRSMIQMLASNMQSWTKESFLAFERLVFLADKFNVYENDKLPNIGAIDQSVAEERATLARLILENFLKLKESYLVESLHCAIQFCQFTHNATVNKVREAEDEEIIDKIFVLLHESITKLKNNPEEWVTGITGFQALIFQLSQQSLLLNFSKSLLLKMQDLRSSLLKKVKKGRVFLNWEPSLYMWYRNLLITLTDGHKFQKQLRGSEKESQDYEPYLISLLESMKEFLVFCVRMQTVETKLPKEFLDNFDIEIFEKVLEEQHILNKFKWHLCGGNLLSSAKKEELKTERLRMLCEHNASFKRKQLKIKSMLAKTSLLIKPS